MGGKLDIVAELFQFLLQRKKWWLTPIIALLVVMSLLIVYLEGTALAPLIYALF